MAQNRGKDQPIIENKKKKPILKRMWEGKRALYFGFYKANKKFCSRTKSFCVKTWNLVQFKSWKALLYPYMILMIIFILLPLLIVALYSVIKATNNTWIFRFTWQNYVDFLSEPSYLKVFLRTFYYALIASIVAIILGYPVAYIMAFMSSHLANSNIWVLVTLPIWINMLLRTIGLQIIFNLIDNNILIGTSLGIILGMIYMYLPFVILPIYNSLTKINKNLLEASKDLGASNFRTFRKITLRFSMPGIVAGFSLMMLSAMTTLVVSKYLGEGKISLISNIIEKQFYLGVDFGLGAAISVVLGIIVLIILWSLKALGRWAVGGK